MIAVIEFPFIYGMTYVQFFWKEAAVVEKLESGKVTSNEKERYQGPLSLNITTC